MNVGEKIKRLSYQKGLSQTELARLKGVTKQTISHDLKQKRLSVDSINWYAKTLNVSVEELTKSDESQMLSMGEDWKEMYFQALRKIDKLTTVILEHGIKVDLGKFKSGLAQAFGSFFYSISTQKPTHLNKSIRF